VNRCREKSRENDEGREREQGNESTGKMKRSTGKGNRLG